MTILDSFYLLFESDASKLDKGLDESEKKAKKLTKEVITVDVAARKMGESLGKQLKEIGGAIVAYLALRSLAQSFIAAEEAADKLDETAERLGQNIESLSAWGDLVKKSGGSTEGFIASIEGLNSMLQQMEVTGKSRAAPFLKELGIDLELAANKGKSAMEFLPQIADAFAGMDKQKSTALGRRLGFDQATIMMLQAGRREVEALLEKEKDLGVITKKQGEIAGKFGDQMDDLRHAFRSFWLGIMERVLPPLTSMGESFQKVVQYMSKHADFLIGLVTALGAALLVFVVPPLLAMAAPFIAVGALVAALSTAFALLYDDVTAFIDGSDSMIGAILDWLGSFELLNAALGFLAELLRFVWRGVTEGVEAFRTLLAQSENVQAFFAVLGEAVDLFLTPLRLVWQILKGLGGAVGEALGAIGGMLGKGVEFTTKALIEGKGMLAQASGTGLASQTSNSISNVKGGKSTNVQVGKVEVHTQATDVQGISKAIGGTMQTQMRQAVNNFDDGVLA